MCGAHKLPFARTPFGDSADRVVQCLSLFVLSDPMDGRQKLHPIRTLETLNELGYSLYALVQIFGPLLLHECTRIIESSRVRVYLRVHDTIADAMDEMS